MTSKAPPSADYGLGTDYEPDKYEHYSGPAGLKSSKDGDVSAPIPGTDDLDSDSDGDLPGPALTSRLTPIDELDGEAASLRRSSGLDVDPTTVLRHKGSVKADAKPVGIEESTAKRLSTEQRYALLFSRQHLEAILADPMLCNAFQIFLRSYKAASARLLDYYFATTKILNSMRYAEAVAHTLPVVSGYDFTFDPEAASTTLGFTWVMQSKIEQALDALTKDDLAPFVSFVYMRIIDAALVDKVTGTIDALFSSSDSLAESFLITDPAKSGNPIAYSSDGFHLMTGFSKNEIIGQTSRALHGDLTSESATRRIEESIDAGRAFCEVLVNYRKDESSFISMTMGVPLKDRKSKIRYWLRAFVDVTCLLQNSHQLESFHALISSREANKGPSPKSERANGSHPQIEFDKLMNSFNPDELRRLVALGRRKALLAEGVFFKNEASQFKAEPNERASSLPKDQRPKFSIEDLFYHDKFLVVRPSPSTRILFTSASLQDLDLVQKPFLDQLRGTTETLSALSDAFESGRKVTANVRWSSTSAVKSDPFWIHCTPLLGTDDLIGVWVINLVNPTGEVLPEPALVPQPEAIVQLQGERRSLAVPWDAVKVDEAPESRPLSTVEDETIEPEPASGLRNSIPLLRGPSDRPATRRNEHSFAINRQSVTIAGELRDPASFERQETLRKPAHDAEKKVTGDGKVPTGKKRTYKSLSPYGVLFDDQA